MRRAVLCLLLCSCAPTRHHESEKPEAPVTVSLGDRDLGGGDHELTLTAVPTAPLASMTLVLDGHTTTVGATAAGQSQTLTARVHVAAGQGVDVVGGASAGAVGHVRNRAAVLHLGAAVADAPAHATTLALPDGTIVREVRP